MTKVRVKPVIRQFFIDDEGKDKLIVKSTDKTVAVFLKLRGDNRKRRIGVITKSTRTMAMKRKRAEHLFRIGNAYGFNDFILREAKLFDTVRLSDEYSDWKLPVSYILEKGRYLNFTQQGFELQRFVSLEELEQFRVLPKENRRF